MNTMLEQHYTPVQLAKNWGMSVKQVRAMFAGEVGVLRTSNPETKHKRGYTTSYIPESVALKVYRSRLGKTA